MEHVTARELALLLEELRARDSEQRVFGSATHRYRDGRRRSARELDRFEARHAIVLPDQLRELLMVIGDGAGGPGYGINPLERMVVGDPAKPCPIFGADPEEARDGVLVVADYGCCIDVMIVVTGTERGAIWAGIPGDPHSRLAPSLFDWYATWARQKLRVLDNERVIPLVRVGMTLDEVRAATGREWTTNQMTSAIYGTSPDVPLLVIFDPPGRVAQIKPVKSY